MMKYSNKEIFEDYQELIRFHSYKSELSQYKIEKILEYANNEKLKHIEFISQILLGNPDYPDGLNSEEEKLVYWCDRDTGYQDACRVIDLIIPNKSSEKTSIKESRNRNLNTILDSKLTDRQLIEIYSSLILPETGFFLKGTSSVNFYKIFSNSTDNDKTKFIYLKCTSLFVYFMQQLHAYRLIENRNYARVIEQTEIFIKNSGGNRKDNTRLIKAGDMHSAKSQMNDILTGKNPIGAEKIDAILKRVIKMLNAE